ILRVLPPVAQVLSEDHRKLGGRPVFEVDDERGDGHSAGNGPAGRVEEVEAGGFGPDLDPFDLLGKRARELAGELEDAAHVEGSAVHRLDAAGERSKVVE